MTTEDQREPMSIRLSPRERATAQAIAHMNFGSGVGDGLRTALLAHRDQIAKVPALHDTLAELEKTFLTQQRSGDAR